MIIADLVVKIASRMTAFLNIKFSVPLWIFMLQIICAIIMIVSHRYVNDNRINKLAFLKEQERAVKFKEFYITNFINITNRLSLDYGLDQQDIIILSNSIIWGKYD